jgi:hypothetical protein
MFDLKDLVTIAEGGHAVCDHQNGQMPTQIPDAFHYFALCNTIQGTRCFIENQNFGLFVKSPGNANPLPLAAGNPDSPLTDLRLITFQGGFDKLRDLGLSGSFPNAIHVDVSPRSTKRDVFGKVAVREENGLRYMGNIFLP